MGLLDFSKSNRACLSTQTYFLSTIRRRFD